MNSKGFRSHLSRLLAILLVASVLTGGKPASAQSSTRSPTVTASELERQEELLVHEIDRQADAVFAELKRQQPDLPVTIFQKTQREAVYRLRQMHVLSNVLKSAGPAPAIALLAGEVLTTFVLAPMFAAKGNMLMATAMVTVPWGIFAASAAASYEMMKHRWKLARDLKTSLRSLREADRIRELVLGYDVKYRVSTAMFEMMKGSFAQEIEFEIVKKMKNGDATRTPFITVSELEQLVKSTPEGAIYIQRIYFERLDRELFTALLLRHLDENTDLAEKLLEILKSRNPLLPVEASVLRQHLLATDDLKKLVARDLLTIQHETKALKKKLKAGELNKEQVARAKDYLKDESKRLQRARGDVLRHEYALLLDVKSSYKTRDFVMADGITREYSASLAQLRVTSRHVPLDLTTLAPPEKRSIPRTATPIAGPRQCMNVFGAAATR